VNHHCAYSAATTGTIAPRHTLPQHSNTLGVCHQLSNGFELKHDMLSGSQKLYSLSQEGMEMSWSNL
jgi:hypothetical protein